MKAIVVTDQAAGTAGMTLVERPEPDAARLASLSGANYGDVVVDEGWELGRVARPPIHDVLRLAHFLRIPADEIQRAVFEDAGEAPAAEEVPDEQERKKESSSEAAS